MEDVVKLMHAMGGPAGVDVRQAWPDNPLGYTLFRFAPCSTLLASNVSGGACQCPYLESSKEVPL